MRYLSATELAECLPWPALLQALRQAFRQDFEVPQRHSHTIANPGGAAGTVLLMPAWQPGRHFGVKTVNIFPGNRALGLPALHAVYALFDATTGVPLALLDGGELTARRTAAASALASGMLARPDARGLLLVGAGRVGALMTGALLAVRPGIERIAVWNRSPAGAAALAATLRGQGHAAQAVTDLEAAVRQADIISCATLSTAALIHGDWLQPGSHLDLIGSFTPAMREADGACLARGRVFVDTAEALAKSGDLLSAIAEGHFAASRVQATLAQLCRGERAGRKQADEITVFKAVGTALADLAAAELAMAGV